MSRINCCRATSLVVALGRDWVGGVCSRSVDLPKFADGASVVAKRCPVLDRS